MRREAFKKGLSVDCMIDKMWSKRMIDSSKRRLVHICIAFKGDIAVVVKIPTSVNHGRIQRGGGDTYSRIVDLRL